MAKVTQINKKNRTATINTALDKSVKSDTKLFKKDSALLQLWQKVKIETKVEDLELTLENTGKAVDRTWQQYCMLKNFKAEVDKQIKTLKKSL